MATSVITNETLDETILDICTKALDDYKKYEQLLSENLVPLSKESYHFFTNILHPNTREEKVIFNLLFSAIFRAEKMAGGSAFLTYLSSLHLYRTLHFLKKELPANSQEFRKEWDLSLEKFKAFLEAENRPILRQQLERFVLDNFEDESLGSAVWAALEMAGLEGSIFVEDGKTDKYVVEAKDGFRFPLKTYKFFLQNQTETKLRNPRVLIVDGILETIGEIDHLLMKSQQEATPLVIFAQGFNEEIIATLKHNIDLGRLRVFPVKIPTEIESLNLVNDIAYACNSNIVSALAGQRVSMTQWDDLKIIDTVTLTERETSIVNPASMKAVAVRLDSLTGTFDTKSVLAAFENALRPDKEEMALAKRIYKKGKLPMVDAKVVAGDLLHLSYNDLSELAGIQKTPMVITQDEVDGVVDEQVKLEPKKAELTLNKEAKKA